MLVNPLLIAAAAPSSSTEIGALTTPSTIGRGGDFGTWENDFKSSILQTENAITAKEKVTIERIEV